MSMSALAESDADAVVLRLVYRAPPECPGRDEFIQRVSARTNRARFVEQGQALTLNVELESVGGRSTGRMRLEDLEHQSDVRSMTGATCAEVVSALALTTALSIDPDAKTSEGAWPDAHEAPPSKPRDAAPREIPPAKASDVEAPQPQEVPVHWSVDASTTYAGVLAPERLWGAAMGLEAALTALPTRPSAHLAIVHARNDLFQDPGQAVLTWSAAAFDLCPVSMTLGSVLAAPCLSGYAALFHGRGRDLVHFETTSSFGWGAGIAARAQWPATGTWAVALDATGTATAVTQRFVIDRDKLVVASTPRVVFDASAGVACRF
jgi:hypothetical protein